MALPRVWKEERLGSTCRMQTTMKRVDVNSKWSILNSFTNRSKGFFFLLSLKGIFFILKWMWILCFMLKMSVITHECLERNVLRPIVGQIRLIHSYPQGLLLDSCTTMRRVLSVPVGVQLLDYPVTREGENPQVWRAKLYVLRKKDKAKTERRGAGERMITCDWVALGRK